MTATEPILPQVSIRLTNEDTGRRAILTRVLVAMDLAEVPATTVNRFTVEATMAPSEEAMVEVIRRWVTIADGPGVESPTGPIVQLFGPELGFVPGEVTIADVAEKFLDGTIPMPDSPDPGANG